MITLKSISIRPALTQRGWIVEATADTAQGEMQTTQNFEDFGGFLLAVQDMGTFFAVRDGKIKSKEANARISTRILAPNPHGSIQ